MQRRYVFSSKCQSRAFATIPEGTIIGPVIEVQIVKIVNQYGLEIAFPSPNDGERTSYVLLSRGKSRFVDEIHIPNGRTQIKCKIALWTSEIWRRRTLLDRDEDWQPGDWCGPCHKSKGIKQTCADTLSISPSQASFFAQRTIPTTERKWKVFPARSSYGGALSIAVSKMVSRMVRHYDQDERQTVASLHWDTLRLVLLKAFAKHGARDFLDEQWLRLVHEGSSKTRFEYPRGFQKFLGLLSINSRTLWWNTHWPWVDGVHSNSLQLERVNLSQWLFFQHPICPWERTDSGWKGKRQRTADYLLHTALPFTPMKKNPSDDYIGNVITMPCTGWN